LLYLLKKVEKRIKQLDSLYPDVPIEGDRRNSRNSGAGLSDYDCPTNSGDRYSK